MTGQAATEIINRLLQQQQRGSLKTLQVEIINQVCQQRSYHAIGRELSYEPEYIKQAAAQLWKLLSELVGEKVSRGNLCSILQRYQPSLNTIDWGEAIDISHFYGRSSEIENLRHWIVDCRCRLVGIFGWGGIGKTALSVKVAQSLDSQFEYVVWRSLSQAPSLKTLLAEILPILGAHSQESCLDGLIERLQHHKCLLVLDNVESILQPGEERSSYLRGYEDYGNLFARVGDEVHQSCLLLTGREKPGGIGHREGVNLPVRSLRLQGLKPIDAQKILADKGLSAPSLDRENLIDYVKGNPLAIKLVVTTVQSLFGGDIRAFLAQGTAVFGNLQDLLAQQFDRCSPLQQQVMYWLAVNREAVTPQKLQGELLASVSLSTLLASLETLHARAVVESSKQGLTQQPVIMEYVTARFVQKIETEIVTGELQLFCTHALIEAQTRDYLRDAQIQLILQPLIERLLTHFTSRDRLEAHLLAILHTLRDRRTASTGYAAGNIINLFCHLKTDLQGYDLSRLSIRQAYLLNTNLHNVDLTRCEIDRTVFAETFGGIMGIAFSPDGKLLVTSDSKGSIQIWDASTLERQATCEGHQHWTWAVSFSPDGQYLASASDDRQVKLWNVATGECAHTYTGHTDSVNAVTFNHARNIIASSAQDRTIRLWWVLPSSGAPEGRTLQGHASRVWSIAFSPDDRILASGGEDCQVRLWDVETGECLYEWLAHEGWVRCVAFSTDGELLVTASYDRTIKIWQVATQVCLKVLTGHQHPITAIAFSPDNRQLVSSSFDRTIKIWDVSTGKCLNTLFGHSSRVWNVVFHPNGRYIASAGDDHTAKIWDLTLVRCVNTLVGHSNAILSIDISPDLDFLVSGSEDSQVRIWNIYQGKIQQTLRGHTNRVWSVNFSPSGHLLASGSADTTIKIWDWQSENCLCTLSGHTSWVWKVCFSPDGRYLASSSYDRTVKLWDVNRGSCLHTFVGHTSPVIDVSFSPDGKLLASGEFDGLIKLWDVERCELKQNLVGHSNSAWSVTFSNDGRWLLSASFDKTIWLWSVEMGECIQTFLGHEGQITRAKFSPDERSIISTGLDRTVKVWDIQSGECLQTLTGHSDLIYTLKVAEIQLPDRHSPQHLAFTGSLDETIKVWDLDTAKCLASWTITRPYEGMKIDRIQGLTPAQISTLKALGATEATDIDR